MARRFEFFGSYTSFAFEAETIAYMNAIGIADDSTIYYSGTPQQITGNGLWLAVNDFFLESKPNTWYTKCNSLHPYIGGTADRHKYNALNPIDSDVAFRETYFGGWTHNELGIIGNGVNGYTNTHYKSSLNQTFNNGGFYIYNRTNNARADYDIGNVSDANKNVLVIKSSDNRLYYNAFGSGYSPLPNTDARGGYLVSWDSSNSYMYKNGNIFQTRVKLAFSTINEYTVGWAVGQPTFNNRNYSFRAMFTQGLTVTEQADFHTAVQNLQIALNRAV